MREPIIAELLQKYIEGTATDAEEAALLQWYREKAYHDAAFPEEEESVRRFMLERLMRETKPRAKNHLLRNFSIAASILALLGLGLFLFKKQQLANEKFLAAQRTLIVPGGNKATLTLADGSKISLTAVANGKVALQNGVQVNKAANGQLVYTISDRRDTGNVTNTTHLPAYNIIETPKGGQYQVVLPDGSKVWMNASSSLKFPLSFAALHERRVELSGEAYFEVSHDPNAPFRVVTAKQTVEVLGTHFDVNAYLDDRATTTTLLQGSVKITSGDAGAMLKPGQQAKVSDGIKISSVNTDEVVAWKNGFFDFDDETLENIMKSVSRWYNVSVVYDDDNLRNETFGAFTTRFASISTLLKLMEQTGDAHFSIEGAVIKISRKKSVSLIKHK